MTNSLQQIQEAIKDSGGNLSHVARVMGVDYHALKALFPQHVSTVPVSLDPEPEDITTLGRKGSEGYVIAVKRSGHPWPEKYHTAIEDARKKFDAGTHEMFQSNGNGWVVQYLIPYLVPRDRRQFFSTMIRM
jgi:hypothetical protein